MLKARVITALVLIALLLPSLFYLPQADWALLVAAFIGVAAWEWGALIGWNSGARIALGAATAALCGGLGMLDPSALALARNGVPSPWILALYGASLIFWLALIPVWLGKKWAVRGLPGVLTGAVVLLPTWLAIVQLRSLGPDVLLGIFAVVWVADIAAYFSGRAFGRRKLAPAISPGKTWEGAVGALLGVLGYGFVIRGINDISLVALPVWIGLLLLVTAVSIVGDLFESLLKRKAGIKDSSNILPGHGGVLDRIDSLTSTLPITALILIVLFHSA